jgi:hypothetical protein
MHANGKPLIAGNWPPLPRRSYSLGITCLVDYRAACIPRPTITSPDTLSAAHHTQLARKVNRLLVNSEQSCRNPHCVYCFGTMASD